MSNVRTSVVGILLVAAAVYGELNVPVSATAAESTPKESVAAKRTTTATSSRPVEGDRSLEEATVQMKARVEAFEARVRKRLDAVDEIARTMDLRRIEPQRLAVGELSEVLADLDEEARAIQEAYGALGPDLRLFRQALEEAPAVFLRIAEGFDAKATGKTTPGLAEAYADVAAQSRKLAAAYRDRAKGIDGLEADLKVKIQFVVESREFCQDVSQFLAAIPATEGGVAVERLVARVNAYLVAFEATLQALKSVSDKIAEPQAVPAGKKPAASADVGNTKLLDYRRRLAKLVK